MEKFKFVNVINGGVVDVIAQSERIIYAHGCSDSLVLHRKGLCFGLSMVDASATGSSSNESEYNHAASHLNLGYDPIDIIASLRSLADELEKALDATQS